MAELVQVLNSSNRSNYGAACGDEKAFNENDDDSIISFITSLQTWIVNNVERACESSFGYVTNMPESHCLYRMRHLLDVLDTCCSCKSNQKFLFNDYGGLIARFVLHSGYKTAYTSRSVCFVESPVTYSEWLERRLKLSCSCTQEWLLYATMTRCKLDPWVFYQSILKSALPFFSMLAILSGVYSGNLYTVISLLLCVQFIGIARSLMSSMIRGSCIMIFSSLFPFLYISSLPSIMLLIVPSLCSKKWTKIMRGHCNYATTCVVWGILFGIALLRSYTLNASKSDEDFKSDIRHVAYGAVLVVLYWITMVLFWNIVIRSRNMKSKGVNFGRYTETKDTEEV